MADKQLWRTWGVARLHDTRFSAAIRSGIDDWLRPGAVVLTYLAMAGEPDLTGLGTGATLAVTRTPQRGPLTVHPFDAPRETHRWGFEQPAEGSVEIDPRLIDVALVPGVLFDRQGGRLGHGRGYYDRLLAGLRDDVARVGIVTTGRIVERLPLEPHDIVMTHLGTERGVRPTPLGGR